LFVLLLLLFPAATSVARWWRGAILSGLEWAGVAVFPLLAWLWLRHFSVFGCQQCDPPAQPSDPGAQSHGRR